MNETAQLAPVLQTVIDKGWNLLIEGRHGVGKTALVTDACGEAGVKVAYFSAPTMDPFTDFVGIPVPQDDHTIRFCRPKALHEADVLFFDELNRAPAKVLNAVFEVIQFRTINGEPLARVRSVIACVNPDTEGYRVEPLDPALVDRFHLYFRLTSGPNRDWFTSRFGREKGAALVDWHTTDLDDAQQAKVSNRRLEFIGKVIEAGMDPALSVPADVKLPFHLLTQRLEGSEQVLDIRDFVAKPADYAEMIARDISIATRFADVLKFMRPTEMFQVRDLILELPSELLRKVETRSPFVFKKVVKEIERKSGKADANAFVELLRERLA